MDHCPRVAALDDDKNTARSRRAEPASRETGLDAPAMTCSPIASGVSGRDTGRLATEPRGGASPLGGASPPIPPPTEVRYLLGALLWGTTGVPRLSLSTSLA